MSKVFRFFENSDIEKCTKTVIKYLYNKTIEEIDYLLELYPDLDKSELLEMALDNVRESLEIGLVKNAEPTEDDVKDTYIGTVRLMFESGLTDEDIEEI